MYNMKQLAEWWKSPVVPSDHIVWFIALINVLHSMGHLRMNLAHVYTGDNKVFPRQTVPGIC